ncbi:MAG: hypothetical protein U0529_06080 [Thermoanaerobaculia bacterium]
MTPGPRTPRLRSGGFVAFVAFVALVAVLWLSVAPHRHSDDWSEKHCAACQVIRGDGAAAPVARALDLVHPSAARAPRAADVVPVPVECSRHGGPPPGRSPPSPLS